MPRADIAAADDIEAEETFGEIFEPMFYAAEGLGEEDLEEYRERVIQQLEVDALVSGETANAQYLSEPNRMQLPIERMRDRLEVLVDEYRDAQARNPDVVAPVSLAEAANVWRAAAQHEFPDLNWTMPLPAGYFTDSGLRTSGYTWPGFRNGRRAF
jgi:hypothetical protein